MATKTNVLQTAFQDEIIRAGRQAADAEPSQELMDALDTGDVKDVARVSERLMREKSPCGQHATTPD